MTLTDAADTITAEIEQLAGWERDLLADLERTRVRREGLTRALKSLMATLPEPARAPLRLRLNRIAISLAGELRAATHETDKVTAVHGFLAQADGVVTTRQVQRFLERHGLAPYPDAAAMILARKAKQGVVERVARGRYAVNREHPVFVGVG